MTDQKGNNLAKLELFASPLIPETKEEASESRGDDIQLQNGFGTESHRGKNSANYTRMNQDGWNDLPAFQRHEEATNIELFCECSQRRPHLLPWTFRSLQTIMLL